MVDGEPGGDVELLYRPAGHPGKGSPPRAKAGSHVSIRPVPEQRHGVTPVRGDAAHGAVPGPVGREDDDLRRSLVRSPGPASGSAELDENRSGGARKKCK